MPRLTGKKKEREEGFKWTDSAGSLVPLLSTTERQRWIHRRQQRWGQGTVHQAHIKGVDAKANGDETCSATEISAHQFMPLFSMQTIAKLLATLEAFSAPNKGQKNPFTYPKVDTKEHCSVTVFFHIGLILSGIIREKATEEWKTGGRILAPAVKQ